MKSLNVTLFEYQRSQACNLDEFNEHYFIFFFSGSHYLSDLQVSYALALALSAPPASAQSAVSSK